MEVVRFETFGILAEIAWMETDTLRTVRGNGYRPSAYSCRRKESDGFTKLRHTERNSDAR